MVMCRPTYISGPARNGSIPPITMTDRRGQGCTMFHMYVGKSVQATISTPFISFPKF